MNSVLENSYAWTGSFVDAINKLSCDVASLIFSSLTLTPDPPSHTGDTSSETPVSATSTTGASDKTLLSLAHLWQEILVLFAFDDFQFLLLKIFVAIILGNVCLIYLAWYIYGTRISERFMTPNTSPEEIKHKVLQLKLPKEHSQRYS